MKIKIIFGLFAFFMYFNIWGQNTKFVPKSNNNKNFDRFLGFFTEATIPFNYKKELSKVQTGKVKLIDIPKNYAIKYLQMNEKELFRINISYNYDTDEKKIEKEENLPVAHLKFSLDNYKVLIYRMNNGIDSTLVYLSTMDSNGKSIDKLIVGERFTKEDDWMSFAFLNNTQFRVFKYNINWNNFQKKGQYYYILDKNGPRTTIIMSDYKINENGKIIKEKEFPKQLLKDDILNYKKYDPNNNDIMNLYR